MSTLYRAMYEQKMYNLIICFIISSVQWQKLDLYAIYTLLRVFYLTVASYSNIAFWIFLFTLQVMARKTQINSLLRIILMKQRLII